MVDEAVELPDLRFKLRLMLSHATLPLQAIIDGLDWPSEGPSFSVGGPRLGRNGTPIGGKPHPKTMWSYIERHEEKRFFFRAIEDMLPRLEAAGAFFHEFRAQGGGIDLIVHLPGDVNIGDTLPAALLLRLGALGIDLGVEVFPNLG